MYLELVVCAYKCALYGQTRADAYVYAKEFFILEQTSFLSCLIFVF